MPDSTETRVLIRDACAGNEHAVRCLLVMYHPRLRARLIRQMDATVKSKVEPEDILQQVYLEAFKAIGHFTYQGKDSFLRWLFAILDRKLIDEHRALRAERRDVRREAKVLPPSAQHTTYLDLMARVIADVGTPSQSVRKDEALGVVNACLASLPEHYRDVLKMRFIEGRPVADVAKHLNRSIGSVHMICHRALRQLREQAEKLGVSKDF